MSQLEHELKMARDSSDFYKERVVSLSKEKIELMNKVEELEEEINDMIDMIESLRKELDSRTGGVNREGRPYKHVQMNRP